MMFVIIGAISNPYMGGESYVYAETKIIPSISVAERYDSNVFFSPQEFVPGKKLWDFVTTVAPQVQATSKNRQADTSISAGVSGNALVNNPDLNFFSTNLAVDSKLDGWIGRFFPGSKLQISDTFLFTPESPTFLLGAPGNADAFAVGIRIFRANVLTNTASLAGAYALSRTVSLRGDYSYSILRFGEIFVTQTQGAPASSFFFDTNLHQWSVGPSFRLTRGASLNLNYKTALMDFFGPGIDTSVTTRGVEAEYAKTTPDWTVTMSGGTTILEPDNRVFFTGKLAFEEHYDRSTKIQLIASREIAPAYFVGSGALISNTAGVLIEHRLSKLLTITGNVNYAHNEAVPVKILTFDSFTASVLLTYRVTRNIFTSLSYAYNDYNSKFSDLEFPVQRNVVTFSITTLWK